MLELLINQPLFIGFKVDNQLRGKLASLDDAERQYVSAEDSAFLRICMVGEDRYVGKLMDDRLTTDQIDDIRRNVVSIMRKLGHEVRMPKDLQILGCSSVEGRRLAPAGSHLD
jgi:hypothetical protein